MVSPLDALESREPLPRRLNVSDALIDFLATVGVREGYGLVGGAVAGFCDALGRGRLQVRHFRHEAGAAYAATEAFFASGRPSLVFVTSGPGIANALTGMMAARWDGAKVIMVSGVTASPQRGRWPAQETSANTMPISGIFTPGPIFHYATTVESANDLEQVCWRLAAGLARPGGFVAHIALPVPIQTTSLPAPPRLHLRELVGPGLSREDAERYARLLASAPFAIWLGSGALGAAAEVRQLAERTGAPVMCTPRAKGVFPEDHPLYLGVTGLGGHEAVDGHIRAMRPKHILVLGSRLAESASFWEKHLVPSGGFVHVDVDPEVPGTAFQSASTYAVVAEVGAFLRDLLAALPPVERARAPEAQPFESRPETPREGVRVHPRFLLGAIQRVVVDRSDAMVLAESGNSFAWAIHELCFRQPGRFRVSLSFGAMGHTAAGVVGAALARKGKAVALVGDGSLLMNNEISSAVQYRAQAVWIVLNDARYGMPAQGMEALGFSPLEADIPEADFVAIARAMGADGIRIDRECDVDRALEQAMRADGPFVVDVLVDPKDPGPWMKRIQNLILQGAEGKKP